MRNAHPDPGSQTNADPDSGHIVPSLKVEFDMKNILMNVMDHKTYQRR
jgi:hypothetical protein